METMATFGIITSSYSITQEDFDIIDLEIKAEEYDEYMWENELIVDIEHEEEEEGVECSLCIELYYAAAQSRRFSTRLMEKALFCPHHVIDQTPADDSKVSMQNDDKKRKRKEPRKTNKNKRRRVHTIEDGQLPSCSYANFDGQQTSINDDQRPTTSVENANGAGAQAPFSINANMDGGDGHHNGILEDYVETKFKDYLLKSANCSQLTSFLSAVSIDK